MTAIINTSSNSTNVLLIYDFVTIIVSFPIGIFVFSANAMLLFVLSRSKSLKDPTYTMIGCIMALDCIGAIQYILTYAAPVILQNLTTSSSAIFCKAMYYILSCIATTSTGLFTGISYYRYKIVATASRARCKEKELTMIKRFLLCTCIISCIIDIPIIFFATTGGRYCDMSYIIGFEYLTLIYYTSKAVITYIVPLIIVIMYYSRLFMKLRKYIAPISSQSDIEKRMAKNNRILKMLIIVTSIFMISLALYHLVFIYLAAKMTTFASLGQISGVLHLIVSIILPLSYINNVLNPFIYIVYDKNIRDAVKLVLRRINSNINIGSNNHTVTNMLSPTTVD